MRPPSDEGAKQRRDGGREILYLFALETTLSVSATSLSVGSADTSPGGRGLVRAASLPREGALVCANQMLKRVNLYLYSFLLKRNRDFLIIFLFGYNELNFFFELEKLSHFLWNTQSPKVIYFFYYSNITHIFISKSPFCLIIGHSFVAGSIS